MTEKPSAEEKERERLYAEAEKYISGLYPTPVDENRHDILQRMVTFGYDEIRAAEQAAREDERRKFGTPHLGPRYECPACGQSIDLEVRKIEQAARGRGFKAAIRLCLAQVAQRMGYTNAERLIDAMRALEDDGA